MPTQQDKWPSDNKHAKNIGKTQCSVRWHSGCGTRVRIPRKMCIIIIINKFAETTLSD